MSVDVILRWENGAAIALGSGGYSRVMLRAIERAVRKAGATGLRDMQSEAQKRIRQRKRLKISIIRKAFRLRRPAGATPIDRLEWAIDVSSKPVPLAAYPHRQGRKGVSVEVNVGKRTLLEGAFVARMKSGHKGIFKRRGEKRLPIEERFGSRPVDALLHKGESEAVAERGSKSFNNTFERLLPIEIAKGAQ